MHQRIEDMRLTQNDLDLGSNEKFRNMFPGANGAIRIGITEKLNQLVGGNNLMTDLAQKDVRLALQMLYLDDEVFKQEIGLLVESGGINVLLEGSNLDPSVMNLPISDQKLAFAEGIFSNVARLTNEVLPYTSGVARNYGAITSQNRNIARAGISEEGLGYINLARMLDSKTSGMLSFSRDTIELGYRLKLYQSDIAQAALAAKTSNEADFAYTVATQTGAALLALSGVGAIGMGVYETIALTMDPADAEAANIFQRMFGKLGLSNLSKSIGNTRLGELLLESKNTLTARFGRSSVPKETVVRASDNIVNQLKFGADDLVYGPSAGGKLRELQQQAGGKLLTDIPKPVDKTWIQFSIDTMEGQLRKGGTIRFDLSHMDDMPNLLKGQGQFANSITAQELRYLQSNWDRFSNQVVFYKKSIEVKPPWKN